MIYNKTKLNKKSAFSLVEVLISLVLISLVMVAMAPVITKKISDKTNDGVVFTYNKENNTSEDNVCYITNISNYGSSAESYVSTNECSEYQFKVPDGVHKINLTLVAGGGGGGGAAGGKIETKTLSTKAAEIQHAEANGFKPDILKEVKINTLVSKGQKGSSINSDCNGGSNYVCSGKGGDSSVAFVEFPLPSEYVRGINFSNTLSTTNLPKGIIKIAGGDNTTLQVENSKNGSFSGVNKVVYGVQKTDTEYKPYCIVGNTRYDMNATGSSVCGITSQFITDTIKGANGRSEDKEKKISYFTFNSEMIFTGGTGASVGGGSSYGSGGTGAALKLTCKKTLGTCDKIKELSLTEEQAATEGKSAYVSAEYTVEYPGGTGGGGAGGTGVRIVGFDVIPQKTYTIRVGKGGLGGVGSFSSKNPENGQNGGGGVSSAIYDEDGNLIFMVNGGAGGEGGKIYNGTTYTGEIGASARIFPKILSGIDDLLSNIALDKKVAVKLEGAGDNSPLPNVGGKGVSKINVQYPYINSEPFKTLNYRTGTNSSNFDSRTGGFSAFDINNVTNDTISHNGANISEVYDGFYYRNLINNLGSYIGGLGGFSGVSQKAGCGGYFMGNFDGRTAFSNLDFLINKFVVDGNLYSVSTYYTNCNINSPNGTTPEFVFPKPNSSDFGSAGSGGGGGGYNINAGSGNGGDGQDGYVMIEWRK